MELGSAVGWRIRMATWDDDEDEDGGLGQQRGGLGRQCGMAIELGLAWDGDGGRR